MPFNRFLIIQLLVSILFFTIFFLLFIYSNNFIQDINHQKSIYPILVYANSQKEINQIKEFAESFEIVKSHNIIHPDSLEKNLLQKYNINEYQKISSSYRLPFLFEINLKPYPYLQLMDFYQALTKHFPKYIIHKNEKIWSEIDIKVNNLKDCQKIMSYISLIFYILLMLFIRIVFVSKNETNLKAIYKSGLSIKKLISTQKWYSFYFILIVTIFSVILSLSRSLYYSHVFFVDLNFLVMFFMANLLIVFLNKPFFKQIKIKNERNNL